MKKWLVTGIVMVTALCAPLAVVPAVGAADIWSDACSKGAELCGDTGKTDTTPLVQVIVNFLMWLAIIIAVIVIILGGIKYAASGGDAGKVQSAKNTVISGVIGAIVAVLSYALVKWALTLFKVL